MTRQAVYVERNVDSHSCEHCCRGKTINITYSECVFVAFGTLHAMRMFYIFICGLSGFTIFVYISQKGTIFEKKLSMKCVF